VSVINCRMIKCRVIKCPYTQSQILLSETLKDMDYGGSRTNLIHKNDKKMMAASQLSILFLSFQNLLAIYNLRSWQRTRWM